MKSLLLLLLLSATGLFAQNKEIKTYYDNGAVKSMYHYSDASNYAVTNYFQSGTVMETGRFVNGKMDGTWISYHESGLRSGEAFYALGQKTGEWKMFDETGSVRYKLLYANNKLVNASNFDSSGKAIAETKSK